MNSDRPYVIHPFSVVTTAPDLSPPSVTLHRLLMQESRTVAKSTQGSLEKKRMELDDLIRRRDQLNQQLMIHCSNKGSSPAHTELLTIEGALAYLRHHKGLEDARPSSLVCDL